MIDLKETGIPQNPSKYKDFPNSRVPNSPGILDFSNSASYPVDSKQQGPVKFPGFCCD